MFQICHREANFCRYDSMSFFVYPVMPSRGQKNMPLNAVLHLLLPKNLLDLADLFLDFAGYLFTGAFGFQL
jgi:hypothetical protein